MTALSAFSEGKLLDMLRSAALLSPVAYLGQMPSILARTLAQAFSTEVTSFYHIFTSVQILILNFVGTKLYSLTISMRTSCFAVSVLVRSPRIHSWRVRKFIYLLSNLILLKNLICYPDLFSKEESNK